MDWLTTEPGAREELNEWTRLARRATRRPVVTLLLAILLGALILYIELRRPPLQAIRAEVLITESSMTFERRTISRGDLRAFVEGVALSSQRLLPIMKRYGLLVDEMNRGPSLALAEMRKAIEVEIFQDYFAEDRYPNGPVRSARVAITFRDPSLEIATAVVREFGALVARAELARHGDNARQRLVVARARAEGADRDLQTARQEVAALETTDPEKELSADKVVRLRRWRALLVDAERRSHETELEATAAHLAWAAEEKKAGTRVHVAGVQASQFDRSSTENRLARKTALAALAGLGLSLLLVGAYDPRLYDLDDVRRAGWEPLGHLRGKGET